MKTINFKNTEMSNKTKENSNTSTILITGGHSGIGLECVKHIASNTHHNIVLAGRSPNRMKEFADQIRQSHGTEITTLLLDTSSLGSVREAAQKLKSMMERGEIKSSLHSIICNAGGRSFGAVQYSPDGYENTFASNYLGHFLLVHLLIDSIADDGRIVFTSSGTHDPDTVDGKGAGPSVEPDARKLAFDGKDGNKSLSGGVHYATSKLCMILFAYELHRRLRSSGSNIASIAFDPGSVPGTSFLRNAPALLKWVVETTFARWVIKRAGITIGNVDFSGKSLAKLAIDPFYTNASGKYFQVNDGTFKERRSSIISYDEERAAKLWQDSKQLVGLNSDDGI